MGDPLWKALGSAQAGLLSHRQLRGLGVSAGEVRHHVEVGRWARRTREVVSTTTGPLSREQRLWLGVLHGGPSAMIGGLSATEHHGMERWTRDEITVLVGNPMSFEPVEGYTFFRTRRPYNTLIASGELPVCRVEPAVLLFASREANLRTALGAVTATVQQRLTTADRLREWVKVLAPLRRAGQIRQLLDDIAGGAQSLAEIDVRRACRDHGLRPPRSQTARFDRAGSKRYTDCEWTLPDGTVVVLEVDGSFHDAAEQATLDRRRNRRLAGRGRIVIQCTAWEIRHEPWEVIEDLVALGVPRLAMRVGLS